MEDWQQAGLWCSFCGKSNEETFRTIAGPQVYICDECILLAFKILAEECSKWKKQSYGKEIGYSLGVTMSCWEYK